MRLPTTGTIVGVNILLAACVLAGWDDDSQKPPPLSTLIKQLERGEDFERSDALRRMEEYGPEAAPATPAVRRALKSGDQDMRELCLDVLAKIGPAAKPALPDVIKLLDESEQGLYAGSAALRIRPVGMKDVPRLIEELKGPEEGDRAFAAFALGRVCWGAKSRYHVGPSMDLPVAALAAALTDKSDRVRALAADALGLIGRGTDKAVAALIEQLETGRPRVRLLAVRALGGAGAPDRRAVEALARVLTEDADPRMRKEAVEAIGGLGRRAGPAVPALVAAVKRRDEHAAVRAARALGRMGEQAAPAAGALVEVVGRTPAAGDDAKLRTAAAGALGEVLGWRGPAARRSPEKTDEALLKSAVAALMAAAAGPGDEAPKAALWSVGMMGPRATESVPALTDLLTDRSFKHRREAALTLGCMGDAGRVAIPALRKVQDDQTADAETRQAALHALTRIAPKSPEVVDHLARALDDRDERITWTACQGLKEGGERAVAALIRALADEKEPKVLRAAEALRGSGQAGAAAAEALSGLLDHKSKEVRIAAVRPRDIGPAAAAKARAKLLELAMGKDDVLTHRAVEALARAGITDEMAGRLCRAPTPQTPVGLTTKILTVLLAHPRRAMALLEADPNLIGRMRDFERAERWGEADAYEPLLMIVGSADPAHAELRRKVLSEANLPSSVMAWSGQERFLPVIRGRLDKADPHRRTFLKTCARACGEAPDRVVVISETQPGDFYPASVTNDGDLNRGRPRFGHGDGQSDLLVTGRLLMPDGRPAVEPRFFDTNDRWLMGERIREPARIRYDGRTGRFAFLTSVFAAYVSGGKEPGPYETGPARVRIEARGAEPLEVLFFDEMPEVAITLSPAKEKAAPK